MKTELLPAADSCKKNFYTLRRKGKGPQKVKQMSAARETVGALEWYSHCEIQELNLRGQSALGGLCEI